MANTPDFETVLKKVYKDAGAIYGDPMDLATDMPLIAKAAQIYCEEKSEADRKMIRKMAIMEGWYNAENTEDKNIPGSRYSDPDFHKEVGIRAGFGKG